MVRSREGTVRLLEQERTLSVSLSATLTEIAAATHALGTSLPNRIVTRGAIVLKLLKRLFYFVAVVIAVVSVVVVWQVFAFGSASTRVWEVPPMSGVVASSDSTQLARGQHVANSYGGCTGCHGPNLGGGLVEDLGPIGVMQAPNLTDGVGGVGALYSDAQLARAIKHGIGHDGTSLRFMPTGEHNWWPDEDIAAVVSYVRSVPPVDREVAPTEIGLLGKVLQGFGMMPILSAELVDHDAPTPSVQVARTAQYGSYLARSCTTCHGDGLGGGKIPGAPGSLPVPRNLTPHETGLAGWSFAQFDAAMRDGKRPDGTDLDPFMPRWATLNDLEMAALWEYLTTISPRELGER